MKAFNPGDKLIFTYRVKNENAGYTPYSGKTVEYIQCQYPNIMDPLHEVRTTHGDRIVVILAYESELDAPRLVAENSTPWPFAPRTWSDPGPHEEDYDADPDERNYWDKRNGL